MKPLDFLGLKWSAVGWLMLGRKEAALAAFDRLLARWPDDTYALASRAHLHAQMGKVDAALADSRRLMSLRTDHAGTWFNHGFMLEAAGLWDEALAAFQRAIGPTPMRKMAGAMSGANTLSK